LRRAKAAAPKRSAGGRITYCATSYGSASQMKFFYVYILQSKLSAEHFYTGFTEDLQARLKKHNAGHVPHTIKFRPWGIKTTIAFTERQRALEFERYLKSASGRAFAKKRL
jgi:putative endonuclease